MYESWGFIRFTDNPVYAYINSHFNVCRNNGEHFVTVRSACIEAQIKPIVLSHIERTRVSAALLLHNVFMLYLLVKLLMLFPLGIVS